MTDNMTKSQPSPDPTEATNDSLERLSKVDRDYTDGQVAIVETRLDAMDRATKIFSDNLNRVPTDLQIAIKSFGDIVNEKFKSINDKFTTAESWRLEQKSDSKTSLDAALSAQKEAAATQDINNQKAIDKSEKATSEVIKNNQDTNKQSLDNLTKTVDELKTEVATITAAKQGAIENRSEVQSHANVNGMYISIAITVISTLISFALLIFYLTKK
jgi:hypothetical protein